MPDAPLRVGATRTVGEYGFLRIEELDLETPAGTAKRIAVRHPGAVAVVAENGNEVMLIRQYRAPVGDDLLEIPAGKLDVAGEPPEVTAMRELEEEVGYRAATMSHVADFYTAPGFTDEHMRLYHATGLTPVAAIPHGPEEEAAEIVALPIADIPGTLASGAIRDAKTFIGLQWLLLHRS